MQNNQFDRKVFVLGLPRTGTTSLCTKCLHWQFRVAHCCLTKEAFSQAEVIADTPVFSDFKQLDLLFPNSLYIYLQRPMDQWLPSISLLLDKMKERFREKGLDGFHPLISRSFNLTFPNWVDHSVIDFDYLADCYEAHEKMVMAYFRNRQEVLLKLSLLEDQAEVKLATFLEKIKPIVLGESHGFECLNANGKINSWQSIKHPLKVDAMAFGEDRRRYFDYVD